MTTELAKPSFITNELIQQELREQETLVDPRSLFPRMRLNKEIKGFMINMGDQIIGTPTEVNFLILGADNFYGSRALFAPGDDSTTPVCATRLESPGKKPWTGYWNDESGYPNPTEGEHKCNACPWSKFGSEPQWDSSKSGGGPACKERRVIYGVMVEESKTERGRFGLIDETVIKLVLPATSISTTKAMVSKATAQGWPLSASCFQLTAKQEARGSIKWCTLQAELIGVIGDENSYRKIQELRKKVRSVVSKDESLDDSSYIDTSATSADIPSETTEDEIPF